MAKRLDVYFNENSIFAFHFGGLSRERRRDRRVQHLPAQRVILLAPYFHFPCIEFFFFNTKVLIKRYETFNTLGSN